MFGCLKVSQKNHGPKSNFHDAVYGDMSFPIEVMDDMILVRTDGTPTYNFCRSMRRCKHANHPRYSWR